MALRFAVCFILAIVASPVRGQPPGELSAAMHVLADKNVQVELELTPVQVRKLSEIWRKHAAPLNQLSNLSADQRAKKKRDLNERWDKGLFDILSGDQRQRLKEVTLQLLGHRAYRDPEVIRELDLTQEQQLLIAAMEDVARSQMDQWFHDMEAAGKPPSRENARKKMIECEKVAEAKAQKLLSDAQKLRWKEMIGKPYASLIVTMAALDRLIPN